MEQCKYEVVERKENRNTGVEKVKHIEKLDLKKFMTTYFSQSVKDDINDEIIQTRIRKETRELKEALESKTGPATKGKKKVVGDKAHQDMLQKQEEEKEFQKRHMEKAMAGIDLSAR